MQVSVGESGPMLRVGPVSDPLKLCKFVLSMYFLRSVRFQFSPAIYDGRCVCVDSRIPHSSVTVVSKVCQQNVCLNSGGVSRIQDPSTPEFCWRQQNSALNSADRDSMVLRSKSCC